VFRPGRRRHACRTRRRHPEEIQTPTSVIGVGGWCCCCTQRKVSLVGRQRNSVIRRAGIDVLPAGRTSRNAARATLVPPRLPPACGWTCLFAALLAYDRVWRKTGPCPCTGTGTGKTNTIAASACAPSIDRLASCHWTD
jgi:hypothetical protein